MRVFSGILVAFLLSAGPTALAAGKKPQDAKNPYLILEVWEIGARRTLTCE